MPLPRLKHASLAIIAATLLAACGASDDAPAQNGATETPPAAADLPVDTGSAQGTRPAPSSSGDIAVGTPIEDPEAAANRSVADIMEPEYVDGFRVLYWEDLLPEGEEERLAQMYQEQMAMLYTSGPIAEGSGADVAMQFGTFNAVEELDEEKVRLPGFTVPFDYSADAKVTEFLLVPYFGACIHAPPPPPNQTILVRIKEPVALRDLSQAVWVNGTLKIEISQTDLADAAYVIEAESLDPYEG